MPLKNVSNNKVNESSTSERTLSLTETFVCVYYETFYLLDCHRNEKDLSITKA